MVVCIDQYFLILNTVTPDSRESQIVLIFKSLLALVNFMELL